MDIEAIAELAHARGLKVIVDNTFMSPYFQRPLELGADMVVHSCTKYLGGHSDVVLGAVITRQRRAAEQLALPPERHRGGARPHGQLPGAARHEDAGRPHARHAENAMRLATWLEAHPAVEKVIYPGLQSHPQHALAQQQMSGFGGMITVVVKGGLDRARRCSNGASSSRWPRAWAAWSRSSSTRPS
jgi:cystathionine gamma-lyase